MRKTLGTGWVLFLLLGGAPGVLRAADETRLPRMDVIGSPDALRGVPGSAEVVDEATLKKTQAISPGDALRRVPGVNVVETDGFGSLSRIGIRGLNPDMSRKVLLLEDGAPIALGPYTDPSAYYLPPIERMERLEVLKGSGSLRYGPSTIGGTINAITRETPKEEFMGSATLRGGTQGFRSLGVRTGGIWNDATGGVHFERKLGTGNRRNNEFDTYDVVTKVGYTVSADQFMGLKFTYFNNDIQETYLGLTQSMFEADPRQNPAANDFLNIERFGLDLNHELQLGEGVVLRSLLYSNTAQRDWWRESFALVDDDTNYESEGTNAGRLRAFRVLGLDSRLEVAHQLFGLSGRAEVGARVHAERMDNRRVNGSTPVARAGETAEHDLRYAEALALFAQNRFELGSGFALTPGVRMEHYRQRRRILTWGGDELNSNSQAINTEWMAGLGGTYQLSGALTVFAGAHQGFAPPRVQDAIDNSGKVFELSAERSVNYELGVRGRSGVFRYETTAFMLDFGNQLVQASGAGGASAAMMTNAGKTLHQGLEIGAGAEVFGGWALDVNWTYLPVAKLTSSRVNGDGVEMEGNRLPYAPEHLGNVTLSYDGPTFGGSVQYSRVSQQFSDFENTVEATADGRRGVLPSYGIWNLSGSYRINPKISFVGTVRNLFDRRYIASRAPQGIFPGLFRTFIVGVRGDL